VIVRGYASISPGSAASLAIQIGGKLHAIDLKARSDGNAIRRELHAAAKAVVDRLSAEQDSDEGFSFDAVLEADVIADAPLSITPILVTARLTKEGDGAYLVVDSIDAELASTSVSPPQPARSYSEAESSSVLHGSRDAFLSTTSVRSASAVDVAMPDRRALEALAGVATNLEDQVDTRKLAINAMVHLARELEEDAPNRQLVVDSLARIIEDEDDNAEVRTSAIVAIRELQSLGSAS
jgi:hypothetical protein